jgi:hypothetical protein
MSIENPIVTPPAFAAKGSRRWLQIAVNRRPEVLDEPLRAAAKLPPNAAITWLSPVEAEGFVEYCDQPTFDRLGIHLPNRPLDDFWPARGPRWDGLARASTGDVFLLEAKAHIGEMVSGASRASEAPRAKIAESLREVQRAIAPGADEVDWTGRFYQYANRLAHLHFLREQNGIPAHLVLVYFLNAADVGGPTERAEYEGASKVIEHYLGVRRSKISRYVHKIFVDVNTLPHAAP